MGLRMIGSWKTSKRQIIVKLDKLYKNMVHDGTWTNTNKKDNKIVALTSSFQEIKKKAGELAKCVTFSGGDSTKGGEGKSKSSDGGAKTTKIGCPEWQVTKKGSSITQDGKKFLTPSLQE